MQSTSQGTIIVSKESFSIVTSNEIGVFFLKQHFFICCSENFLVSLSHCITNSTLTVNEQESQLAYSSAEVWY